MNTKEFYLRRYSGRTKKLRKFFERTEGCKFAHVSSCRKFLVFNIPRNLWIKWSRRGNLMVNGKIVGGLG